jgi:hypothetical membrane protein
MRSKLLYAGILGPVVFCIFFLLAVENFSGYNPFTNYLSDLGVSPAGWFFNAGAAIGGIAGIVFGYAAKNLLRRKAGPIMLMAGGLFLTLISIFTLASPFHTIFAGAFFLAAAVATAIIGLEFKKSKTGILLLATTAACILFAITYIPIIEHIAVTMINLSLVMLVFYLKATPQAEARSSARSRKRRY